MEAEYVAFSTACKDLIPVVAVIRELSEAVGLGDDFVTNLHIKIQDDNVGALILAKLEPGRMTPRSKHYALKYNWFCEFISSPVNRVEVVKVDSRNQLGDIFAKGLTAPTFEYLCHLLMG
ncbi:hypothetical protein ACHAW6_001542 [Cyclotella cf. meneghiniana]